MWGILQFFPIWLGWRVKISLKLTGLDRIYHDTGPQIRSSSKSPIPNMKTRKLTSASHCLQCSWLTMISLKKREERCLFCCSFSKIEACQSVVSLFRPVFLENSFPTFVVWLFNGCECKGILTRDIWPLPSSQIRDSAFLANLKCCLPHKSTFLTSSQIHIVDFLTNPHCRLGGTKNTQLSKFNGCPI